jgi:hypothetical protein
MAQSTSNFADLTINLLVKLTFENLTSGLDTKIVAQEIPVCGRFHSGKTVGTRFVRLAAMSILLRGIAMQIVVGPVLTRGAMHSTAGRPRGGSAAGTLTVGSRMRITRANFEIRSHKKGYSDQMIACNTVDDFVRVTI